MLGWKEIKSEVNFSLILCHIKIRFTSPFAVLIYSTQWRCLQRCLQREASLQHYLQHQEMKLFCGPFSLLVSFVLNLLITIIFVSIVIIAVLPYKYCFFLIFLCFTCRWSSWMNLKSPLSGTTHHSLKWQSY